MEFFTLPKAQAKQGSKAWSRVGRAWKIFYPDVRAILPVNKDKLQGESFWWSTFLPLMGAGFSKARAAQLHRQGLRCIRNALAGQRFLSLVEAQQKFDLAETDRGAWDAATRDLLRMWGTLLSEPDPPPKSHEWVGWYADDEDELPAAVFQAFVGQLITFGGPPQAAEGASLLLGPASF